MTDCMCRGCYSGSGASLHYIPRDPHTRQKWIDFIYNNRTTPALKNIDRIRICSAHFTEECFTNYRQKMMGFGKRLILKPNAVPTIPVQQFTAPSTTVQEKLDEPTAEARLCPLCQRRQKNSDVLAIHLTKKHSVHPACLDNLLLTAPYVNPSSERVRESIAQIINGTAHHTCSENTKSPSMEVQQEGPLQENDVCVESGVGNEGSSHGGMQASVKCDTSSNKGCVAADDVVNHRFKCHACVEFFTHKSALNERCDSVTHSQTMKTGIENDSDSSPHVLSYPYVSTKPYQCDVCHVSYVYAFGLESHLKSVLHQSRTRKTGNTVANSKPDTETGIVVANLPGSTVTNTQLVSAKTFNCSTQAETAASSLLPAQMAVPTVLPLLALAPNSVQHAMVPSVFPQPGTSSTPLIPQPPLLMPLILNGLPTQRAAPEGSQQILHQSVPVLGYCSAQQVQELVSVDTKSQSITPGVSSGSQIPLGMNTSVDGEGVKVKSEIKEEPCDKEISSCTAAAITQLGIKQEYKSVGDGIKDSTVSGDRQKRKAKAVRLGKHLKRRCPHAKKASTTKHLQSSQVGKSGPGKCSPSHANLVLMPSSPEDHSSLPSGTPVLTEFQSQVLWAFYESRNQTESATPPREDCEALGMEVGLTQSEVQKWLVDTCHTKKRQRADIHSRYETRSSDDDEDALMIDESAGTVLSSTTDFLSDEEDGDD